MQKSALFAKPNLKLFLLGAVIVLMVNDLFTALPINASARSLPTALHSDPPSDDELRQWVEYAMQHPGSDIFLQISHAFERRGDYRGAMRYLRHASKMMQMEGLSD